jgi:hypothetical protein
VQSNDIIEATNYNTLPNENDDKNERVLKNENADDKSADSNTNKTSQIDDIIFLNEPDETRENNKNKLENQQKTKSKEIDGSKQEITSHKNKDIQENVNKTAEKEKKNKFDK